MNSSSSPASTVWTSSTTRWPADLLATELDTCWVNVAGEDPCAYIRKYAGRCPVVHLKDFVGSKKEGEVLYALIQADGSDDVKVETEKEPAFDFRPVGYGKQNIPAIIAAGLESGASWFIVEQDRSSERPALDAGKDELRLRSLSLTA